MPLNKFFYSNIWLFQIKSVILQTYLQTVYMEEILHIYNKV